MASFAASGIRGRYNSGMGKMEGRREQWERRLKQSLDHIEKLRTLSAPDCIMANAIAMLHMVARAYLSEEYAEAVWKMERRFLWSRCGLCGQCGEIVEGRSDTCDACEQDNAKFALDAELDAYDGEL